MSHSELPVTDAQKRAFVMEIERIKQRLVQSLPPRAPGLVLMAALVGFTRSVLQAASASSGTPYETLVAAFVRRLEKTTPEGDDLS